MNLPIRQQNLRGVKSLPLSTRVSVLVALPYLILFSCIYSDSPHITVGDLAYFTEQLSSDAYEGRQTGTTGAEKAANFIASYYRRHRFPPAFGESYRQSFSFNAGIEVGQQNQLRWRLAQGEEISETTFLPLPFSPPQEGDGQLIFSGFCIEAGARWNDLANHSVKKRIALCLRYGPGGKENSAFRQQMTFRHKYNNLKKAGASGVIFLGRQGHAPPSVEGMPFSSHPGPPAIFLEPELFFKHSSFLQEAEEALLKGKSSPHVGSTMGYVTIKTDFQKKKVEGSNIGAYLNPPQRGESLVVLGAHYDHLGYGSFASLSGSGKIHNGADDNASGTAAVMEIAHALREKSKSSVRPVMKNVLFLHFDGEERGLVGSKAFIQSEQLPPSILAMINLDMVGRLRPEKGLAIQGAETADALWKNIIASAFESAFETAFEPAFPSSPNDDFDGRVKLHFIAGGNGPSDHSSFYHKGIPVAFFFTGSHRQYHTPEDDFALIDLPGLYRISYMNLLIVQNLLMPEVSLSFRQAPSTVRRSAFEFGVRLGIVPQNYDSASDGIVVADLLSDAPVARSGLQAGDTIVQLGDRPIDNIYDLMDFLSDATTRKNYTLVYRRKGRLIHTKTRLISTQ